MKLASKSLCAILSGTIFLSTSLQAQDFYEPQQQPERALDHMIAQACEDYIEECLRRYDFTESVLSEAGLDSEAIEIIQAGLLGHAAVEGLQQAAQELAAQAEAGVDRGAYESPTPDPSQTPVPYESISSVDPSSSSPAQQFNNRGRQRPSPSYSAPPASSPSGSAPDASPSGSSSSPETGPSEIQQEIESATETIWAISVATQSPQEDNIWW